MRNQFDELAKGLAQSDTRRAALKKFGVGLAAFALAAIGLVSSAQAGRRNEGDRCHSDGQCGKGLTCISGYCSPLSDHYEPCETTKDCRPGLVCGYSSLVGGYVCN